MIKYSTILTFILFSIALTAQQKLVPTDAQMDSLFGSWTDETKPGIAVCVFNDGKKAFQKNWGLANVEHQVPIGNETVFLFPDMAEQMLAFSTLLLVERGSLSLQDQLGSYLDFLPSILQKKTIEDLLHHRTGLLPMNFVKAVAGYPSSAAINKTTFEDLIQNPISTGGQADKYDYSSGNLRLLQLLIEQKTGMDFATFAQQEIFEPLKMKQSKITSPGHSIPHKAQGYTMMEGVPNISNEQENYLACDQLYTTTNDLCLWADNFWRPQIGTAAIWKSMDAFIVSEGQPLKQKNRSQYVGQHRFWDYLGTTKIYQIGVTGSYATKLIRYPDHDLVVAVQGNFGTYNGHLATACSELYLKPFLKGSGTNDNKKNFKSTVGLDLEKYCGKYWDYEHEFMVEVVLENDSLFYEDGTYGWKQQLQLIETDRFFMNRRSGYDVDIIQGTLTLKIPGEQPFVMKKVEADPNWLSKAKDLEGSYYNATLDVSYELAATDEGLKMISKQRPPVAFLAMSQDCYTSTSGYFSRINVKRDDRGVIQGITISNSKMKKVLFKLQRTQ